MNRADQSPTAMLEDWTFIPERLCAPTIVYQFQDDGYVRTLIHRLPPPVLLDTLEKRSPPNLLKLLRYCCKDVELPMMKMESLENHLLRRDSATIEPLSSCTRYQIVLGVALSLTLLHSEKNIIYRDFKASNILLDGYQTSLSDFGVTPKESIAKVNDMDAGEAGDYVALDVSPVFTQSEKSDMEIKMSRRESGDFGDKNEAGKSLRRWHPPSHLQNNWPNMNMKRESQINVYPTLLLIATLLCAITFLIELKIWGCRLEEGYKSISNLNPICQTVILYPYAIRLVIAFNSITFFLSITLMMILFNELPLRPLLLVCASSMLGAYMCLISGPSKPLLSSS